MAASGSFLIFVGLLVLVVAAVGLVRQRLAWTRVIATRRDAGFLLVGGLFVFVLGTVFASSASSPKPAAALSGSSVSVLAPPATLAPTPPSPQALAPTPTPSPVTIPSPRSEPTASPEPTYSPTPIETTPAEDTPSENPLATAPSESTFAPPSSDPLSDTATSDTFSGDSGSDTYTNVDGDQVERPDASSAGATAVCEDGSYSHSRHRSGTCSGHGGVAQWLTS